MFIHQEIDWIKKRICEDSINEKRKNGFKIKHFIPSDFESYRFIYHPFRMPINEKYITNEMYDQENEAYLIHKVRHLTHQIFEIPLKDLPNEKIDNEFIRSYFETNNIPINGDQFREKEDMIFKKMLKVFTSNLEYQCEKDKKNQKKEYQLLRWSEVWDLYQLDFNLDSTCWTLMHEIREPKRIKYLEFSAIDVIPNQLMSSIKKILLPQNLGEISVAMNQSYIENYNSIAALDETKENISIIFPASQDWIIYVPMDCCRTIIGGKKEFVNQFAIDAFEISEKLNADQIVFKGRG